MSRRATLSALGLAVGAIVLAGCASGPSQADLDAWKAWSDDALEAARGVPGVGGLAGGVGSPARGMLDLEAEVPVTGVQLECTGTDLVTFTLSYTAGTKEGKGSDDLVCGSSALIALPAGFTGITAVSVSASSPDGRGAWVAIFRDGL